MQSSHRSKGEAFERVADCSDLSDEGVAVAWRHWVRGVVGWSEEGMRMKGKKESMCMLVSGFYHFNSVLS